MGEFLVYDVDIDKILFRFSDLNTKIVKIQNVESLQLIYIFWSNHEMRVVDSLTLKVVEHRRNLVKPYVSAANFAYVTDIDVHMDYEILYQKER